MEAGDAVDTVVTIIASLAVGSILSLYNVANPSAGKVVCEEWLGGTYNIVEMKPDPGGEGFCHYVPDFAEKVDTRQ